jgi:hypothetical protein
MNKKLIYLNWFNVDPTPGSFRDYYSRVYDITACGVDRFNLLEDIDPQPDHLKFKNIVPEPVYNLHNLTTDWKDRYWSICDQVGEKIFQKAGDREIVLMYSGGIDSTVALVSMMKNPKFNDLLKQNRFRIGLTSNSILEYPEFFYNKILPNMPLAPANYDKEMADTNVFLVTGDAGDYVIGNTDTPIFSHQGTIDNMSAPKEVVFEYLNTIDESGQFVNFLSKLCKKAPFDIVSINQAYWWIGQAFVHQGEMCYPFIWSSVSDLSELPTFNKVFRFFLDDLFNTFTFEYMSTNPYYTDYNSVRQFPREYIVDYTKDQSYLKKVKVFSQKLTLRRIQKTRVYEDLSYEFTNKKVKT